MIDQKIAISFLISWCVHALVLIPIFGTISHGVSSKTEGDEYTLSIGSIQIREAPSPSNATILHTRNGQLDDLSEVAKHSPDKKPESDKSQQALPEATDKCASKPDSAEKQQRGTSQTCAIASLPSRGDSGRATTTSGWGKEDYLGMVRRKIAEAKRYPIEALNEGMHGTALVAFSLHRNGAVTNIRVMKSSLSGILDTEAQRTIHRAAPFPPVPDKIKGEPLDIRVPISFEIVKR
ncbi:MAG: energy transducer TonB [Candidatus Aureabacteria bacterium]|nr:energy transducer TonB [Candidatus Auribacterota bacterium]